MDVETESLKQPVKPALKKHPIHGADGGYSADHEHKKKKELVWDEPTIEEHDKLRGTRMKVCFCFRMVPGYLLREFWCFARWP